MLELLKKAFSGANLGKNYSEIANPDEVFAKNEFSETQRMFDDKVHYSNAVDAFKPKTFKERYQLVNKILSLYALSYPLFSVLSSAGTLYFVYGLVANGTLIGNLLALLLVLVLLFLVIINEVGKANSVSELFKNKFSNQKNSIGITVIAVATCIFSMFLSIYGIYQISDNAVNETKEIALQADSEKSLLDSAFSRNLQAIENRYTNLAIPIQEAIKANEAALKSGNVWTVYHAKNTQNTLSDKLLSLEKMKQEEVEKARKDKAESKASVSQKAAMKSNENINTAFYASLISGIVFFILELLYFCVVAFQWYFRRGLAIESVHYGILNDNSVQPLSNTLNSHADTSLNSNANSALNNNSVGFSVTNKAANVVKDYQPLHDAIKLGIRDYRTLSQIAPKYNLKEIKKAFIDLGL